MKLLAASTLGILALLGGTASAATPIAFSAPLVLPTGFASTFIGPVVIGDLDGDGANDLVATSISLDKPSTISVMKGDGTGKFAAAKPLTFGNPVGKHAVGDFNGDGKADLLVRIDSKHVQILFAQSTAAFTPGPSFPAGTFVQPLVADINGDGSLDVVTVNVNRITSYLGDSHGAFGPPISQSISRAISTTTTVTEYNEEPPAVADFTADGNADIAVGTWIGVRHTSKHHKTKVTPESVIAVIPGRGDGHFGHAVITRVGNRDATLGQPEVADFNHDNLPDLAAGAISGDDQIEATFVALSHGHGHFGKAHCYGFPSCKSFVNESGTFGYEDVSVGDFDANGTADLAVTEFDLGNPRILSGDGHGAFSTQELKGVPFNNFSSAAGDLDHNASDDLVLFNGSKLAVVPGAKP